VILIEFIWDSGIAPWLVRLAQAQEMLKLRPPSYRVIPSQAFEAAGFGQDLPRNEIKGTL